MKPLTSFDIDFICSNNKILKPYFAGVYPRGEAFHVRNILNIPSFFIQNTDFNDEEGRHWLLIFYDHETTYFFDPFGYSPAYYGFDLILERYGKPILRSCKPIQSYFSSACGYHCIVTAFLLLCNVSFYDIEFNYYSNDLTANDSKVYSFFNNKLEEYDKLRRVHDNR